MEMRLKGNHEVSENDNQGADEDTTTEDDQTNSPAENISARDEEVVGGTAGGNANGVGSGGDQMPPTQKKRGRPVCVLQGVRGVWLLIVGRAATAWKRPSSNRSA